MSKYGTCGIKIDGTTIVLNDKKELTANVEKSAQIKITDGNGVVAGLITIEAEGGNPSIHFSGTDTATPIILSGVATPSFNNDAVNKQYVDAKTLPEVTVNDDGKILKVVDGAWAAVPAQ